MKKILLSLFFCTCTFVIYGFSPEVSKTSQAPSDISLPSPMDIPLFLSGNFGELRSNHFHSGIDMKTQGVTGIPVKSVKEGYVSRISISPYGYGNALYITHPDGSKTLYGHLNKFSKKIESVARDSQYIKETFAINLTLSPGQIPVKQGEVIAQSGNTGGSGGPHLHFEIRDAETDEVYDPLPYYKDKIRDNVSPVIHGLMVFPQTGKGVVNGKTEKHAVSLSKDKSGKQITAGSIKAWGDIGIGIKAYDRMTGTSNTYLPKEIILEVDGHEIFVQQMNQFEFSETRYINSLIDYDDWISRKSFYMKSFIEPGNKLRIYDNPYTGIITINEEKIYNCKYTLKDAYGNKTSLTFDIIGEKQNIPDRPLTGTLFKYNEDILFQEENITLTIPSGNLYTDIDFTYKEISGQTAFSPLYQICKRIPLHSFCPLTLKITTDSYPDKSKYGVVNVAGSKRAWIGGEYTDNKISCKIRELGNYTIDIDTIPPKINPVNPAKWTQTGKISFKVTDDLSGVNEFKGTLDDKFILFEYDAKTASIYCFFDATRMKRGKQTLVFKAKDKCGNESIFSKEIIF